MKVIVSRIILCVVVLAFFAECKINEPKKAFAGVWSPVRYETVDKFVITSDSIKAIHCEDGQEHYQTYYKVLRDSVVLLERCWLEARWQGYDSTHLDWHPEEYFFTEAQMYIDKNGYLIIRPFDIESPLSQVSPNYADLKLKKMKVMKK